MVSSYFRWEIFSGNLTRFCRSRDQTAVCLKTGIPGGCDSVSVGISNISSSRMLNVRGPPPSNAPSPPVSLN